MKRMVGAACLLTLLAAIPGQPANAATGMKRSGPCRHDGVRHFPIRGRSLETGSDFVAQVRGVAGKRRDGLVADQVLHGNVPEFLRTLSPVTLSGKSGGSRVVVTICVTPDYLSIGDNRDFVRVPMGLAAAARIAASLGFILPTPKMVDAIYHEAGVKLAPRPMPASAQMGSTEYFWRHNLTVDQERAATGRGLSVLTAGQKKDIVLSNRLRSHRGRVAIYGWHRENGKPIQPLSTVHGAGYADYSHGVRLVSTTAFVNGKPRSLDEILQDPQLARIVSYEGPIRRPEQLLRSLE